MAARSAEPATKTANVPRISVIVPALNEEQGIEACLQPVHDQLNGRHEIIVADGGSEDRTVAIASRYASVVHSPRGRACQMNTGAGQAKGDILLFLHADTLLPDLALDDICRLSVDGREWGRFDVRLSGDSPLLRVVERMMNLRSCLSSVATGDQAMFVRAGLFEQVGCFDDMPLMEDIALSKKLRRHGRAACVQRRVVASSRRWEQQGVLRTILLMWWLRLLYVFGVPPARLAERYRRR